MIKIDWSNAPEWADGHGLISWQGFTEVWINAEQYSVVGREGGPYPWGGGIGDIWHNHTRGQVEYITPRPDRWYGEGLPPVGTVCEFAAYHGGDPVWKECKVIAHDDGFAVINYKGNYSGQSNNHLRPIRTAEQIAAEERKLQILEMIDAFGTDTAIWGRDAVMEICGHLWEFGYRKQVES